MQKDADKERASSFAALQQENEALKARVQWLERVVDEVPAILYASNNTKKTVYWCNSAMSEATGYSLEEMTSMGMDFFREIMHPEDFSLAETARQSFIGAKDVFGGVTRIRRKGATNWYWLVGLAKPFNWDEDGNVKDVICCFLDLTLAMDTNIQLSEAMREVLRRQNENQLNKLTPREKDVFGLAVQGKNNKEIAAELNLSRYTVETHRKNIRLKLKVRNSTELVALAKRIGFQ
ncbi:RNA polymerase sigma factor, sigma-70 family [Chitinophaga costaii]|uniref:RNA polymerase sigma factor, sigma-70 family n=1 Tax=Chitinophaga costaii TaxID=1335309 RepID=A0A1C4F5Q4_9BACT|nr:LuxR C-terminal-related transcriptional regulator [Chitinophaga costaii]PUZ21257.1 LuxR family transcriptional regulator [Chitinophaga costaii]SCC51338.1 RNA polymerase sigma factor, sigma-70 family [Chitinophaga costaii]